jgi:prepilin-type N-terminal cleavage/methylation domain-containing protein
MSVFAHPPELKKPLRPLRGFTIIELLVVVSIIALLIGILLPAIGKARDTARVSQSMSNLRNIGTAQENYSGEWAEKQFTLSREDLGQYASPCAFEQATGEEHPWILLGWSDATLWGFPLNCQFTGNAPLAYPIDFQERYGWFRLPNAKQFNQYVSNRFYDKVWWSPKDKIITEEIERQGCFDVPGEFCTPTNGNTYESSYCLSPAALYSPKVLSHVTWINPKGLAGSCRAPSAAEARFPNLKTRVLEHSWLQNQRPNMCNASMQGSYQPPGCEPYYFLHGSESNPMALFYDNHVEGLSMDAVQQSNKRNFAQVGYRLWNTTTPHGSSGYFCENSYDTGAIESPHILTTDGIYGRDYFGPT